VILCDHSIESAIRDGRLGIHPIPEQDQFDPSSVNLRVGDDFFLWPDRLKKTGGLAHTVCLDAINLADLLHLVEPLQVNHDGMVTIPPEAFVLVRTFERVSLPISGKLAARVEGRSKMARLGLTAHVTAPTIHAGFSGKITLEIINHGPFHLTVKPNKSRLCQLIIQQVNKVPKRQGRVSFSEQSTPLGNPKPP